MPALARVAYHRHREEARAYAADRAAGFVWRLQDVATGRKPLAAALAILAGPATPPPPSTAPGTKVSAAMRFG
jgi:hypothetical protein